MLQGLVAKLEEELVKAAKYKNLTWQWERTFNSQVEATNKAHTTLVSTYKEMQQ